MRVNPDEVKTGDDLYTPVGKRPPVEGRDSLTGGEKLDDTYKDLSDVTSRDIQQAAKFIPPTKLPIAEVRDLRSTRPQNLPCHDGDQQYNHQATSPLSRASTDLSLSLGKLRLTPGDERSPSDFITNDDFEYDDYVPQLPGSYFTMDPQAYTLTWSQQQPWGADKLRPATESRPRSCLLLNVSTTNQVQKILSRLTDAVYILYLTICSYIYDIYSADGNGSFILRGANMLTYTKRNQVYKSLHRH